MGRDSLHTYKRIVFPSSGITIESYLVIYALGLCINSNTSINYEYPLILQQATIRVAH